MVARELERNSVATFSAEEWRGEGEGREGKGRKGEERGGMGGRHMEQQSIGKVRKRKEGDVRIREERG